PAFTVILFKDIQLIVYVVSFSLFAIAPVKQKRNFLQRICKEIKSYFFQCFRVEVCIENPCVPGSIPGRGTIIQKALHENAGLFCFRFMSF
ncbi:MAG TPA: hypothetical protein DCE29_07440, partial [Alteromonas macleodii]|nr:hypothetical protein [Alteromonas macleodii]